MKTDFNRRLPRLSLKKHYRLSGIPEEKNWTNIQCRKRNWSKGNYLSSVKNILFSQKFIPSIANVCCIIVYIFFQNRSLKYKTIMTANYTVNDLIYYFYPVFLFLFSVAYTRVLIRRAHSHKLISLMFNGSLIIIFYVLKLILFHFKYWFMTASLLLLSEFSLRKIPIVIQK